MKHIDSIINRATTSLLVEQIKDKYNRYAVTHPDLQNPETVAKIWSQPEYGDYWPADKPRKKWPNNIETLFTKIGARPVLYGFLKDKGTLEKPENKGLLAFEWPYAKDTYRFQQDGTFVTTQSKNPRVLFWRYTSAPVVITNKNDDDYKGKQIAFIAPSLNYATPDQLTKLTKKFEQENLIDVQLSKPGFGTFIISTKKDGPAEFTIYISTSGQPAIIYAKDAAAIKKKEQWKKSKEETRAVMDILGFVPVVGDALDFVQVLWYMYDFCGEDGEWSDLGYAILSLIAVIPIIGSFIKSGYKIGKAAFKSTKIIRKQKKQLATGNRLTSSDDIVALFEKTVNNPAFTDTELAVIRKGLQLTIGGFLKYAKKARTFMKGNPAKLQRFDVAIQEIDQVYRRFSVSLNKVTDGLDVGVRLADGTLDASSIQKITSLITNGAVKDAPFLKQIGNFITKYKWYWLPVELVKRIFKYSISSKSAQVVYNNIVTTFLKGLNNPEFLRVIYSTSSDELRTEILSLASKYSADATSANRTWDTFLGNIQSIGIRPTDPRYWDRLIAIIPTANRSNFIQELGTTLMSQKHPVWLEIVNDPITQIKNYFPKSIDQFGKLILGNLMTPAKHAKLVVDFFHDATHDAGFNLSDADEQSLLYQALKDRIGEKNAKDMIVNKLVIDPFTKNVLNPALDVTGLGTNNAQSSAPFELQGSERGKEWVDPATKITPRIKSNNKTITPKKKAATAKKKPAIVVDKTGNNIEF